MEKGWKLELMEFNIKVRTDMAIDMDQVSLWIATQICIRLSTLWEGQWEYEYTIIFVYVVIFLIWQDFK